MEEIIVKYLTDEISQEEMDVLENWIQVPENRLLFEKMILTNQRLSEAYATIDMDKAYHLTSKQQHSEKILKLYFPKTILKYAAIILLLITTSIGLYTFLKTDKLISQNEITLTLNDGSRHLLTDISQKSKVSNKNGILVATVDNEVLSIHSNIKEQITSEIFYELNVPYGKHLKVKLVDGTLIHLNAGTRLQFPPSFTTAKSREVLLDGEAYFDVQKNKDLPFIVSTNTMSIEVLGTRFNVSSYSNDKESFVALEEGSVSIKPSFETDTRLKSALLKPGEKAFVRNHTFEIQKTNIKKDVAWNQGTLLFENDRFENIIKKLERHYNMTIENQSDVLNNIRYTGTFTSESLTEVLQTFKELSDFDYEVLNEKIIISLPSINIQ